MTTNTYVALKTTTVGTSASSVTISSIPTGYTDLFMVINLANTTNVGLTLNLNGDTGNNYSGTRLWGNGSAVGADRQSNYGSFILTVADGKTTTVQLQNYTSTAIHKSMISRHSSTTGDVGVNAGLWRAGTIAAINSITVNASPNIAVGSTFTVYGIANANTFAKATGGIITSDATYWYHTFGASGTFTPTQSLTADILVVAGGGGSQELGGGGGAGGLLAFSSQALSATGYTVTVGAGGAGGWNGTGTVGGNGGNSQFGALTTCIGGGGGGRYDISGASGGSGGGGGRGSTSGGSATSGQGYAGGNGLSSYNASAGGGGGAGAAGANATNPYGGAGGVGATSSLINAIGAATGTGQTVSGTTYFAGGGGGGNQNIAYTPAGGYGGGGAGGQGGSVSYIAGQNGAAGTGGGGGGGNGGNAAGGNGGSGIVVVRYAK